MSHCLDPVNPCTTLGHVYSTVLVVRCPSIERYSVVARCWIDNDRDEPDLLFEQSIEFGPFDDEEHIRETVRVIVGAAMSAQREHGTL